MKFRAVPDGDKLQFQKSEDGILWLNISEQEARELFPAPTMESLSFDWFQRKTTA